MDSPNKSFSPEFVTAFQRILDSHGQANDIFQKALAVLAKHSLMYTVSRVKCKYFIPHRNNRGGLLLSPFNAHRNAKRIHKVGADLAQITNAYATELPSAGQHRDAQLTASRNLISRSNGLLAPLNGEERYASLGAGHTAAFCKLAEVGGPTPEPDLQDECGNIDVGKIKRNANFKIMIEDGWDWKIIHADVDIVFPKFSQIAQRALNTANHVATEVGELETGITLAASINDPGMQDLPDWKALAIENIVSLCVPCAGYADVILDYIIMFGDGPGAPMITFMDNVTKQFNANVNMGETFWHALTYSSFASKVCKMPLLRSALALANLTGAKTEDGIAKLLTKSDISKVTHKNNLALCQSCESTLNDALDITKALGAQYPSKFDEEAALAVKGKLFVRVGLLAADKAKLGKEAKEYTLPEIQAMFLKNCSVVIGAKIDFPKWSGSADVDDKNDANAGVPQTAHSSTLTRLEDHSDPAWIAKGNGFEAGKTVHEKGHNTMFTIVDINAAGVTLKETFSYVNEFQTVQVQLDELISNWHTTNAAIPMKMNGGQQRNPALMVDAQKCTIFRALMDADSMNEKARSLVFWRRPDAARTSQRIAKGALTLVPVVQLNGISTRRVSQAVSVGKYPVNNANMEFFLLPVAKPSFKEGVIDFEKEATIAAYWWVGDTPVRSKANMEVESIIKHGIKIPVLKNKVDIEPFTELLKFKPQDKPVALKNATVLDPMSDDDSDAAKKPISSEKATAPQKRKRL
jgi:hypothetical protein